MSTPHATEPVLVADVGGTNVRFALVDVGAAEPLITDSVRRYRGADFETFGDAIRRYLDDTATRPVAMVIAAAGLRVDDEVRLTNMAWVISRAAVQSRFGFASVALINDFAAMGLCVPLLRADDVFAIGTPARASIDSAANQTFAIVGPGTGLGVGALLVRGAQVHALETEGGHTSFAPGDDGEIEILRRLAARFGHVSNERLLSGSGLVNLHRTLCEIAGLPVPVLTPEEITQRAETDAMCRRAVEKFCELLGAVAGDFVLAFGAWDGVYLSGGLAPQLAPWLERSGFRRRFEDKGRLATSVARVPTTVVLHAEPGLLGAAAFALIESGRSAALFSR